MPTLSEVGIPGLDVASWLAVFAPAKTPPAVVARPAREIRAMLPDMKERFAASGGEAFDLPADELAGFVRSEYDAWTKVIRDAGIKLD